MVAPDAAWFSPLPGGSAPDPIGVDERPLRCGQLVLDPVARDVRVNGAPVALRGAEYELLLFFVTHPARVYRREALIRAVWGPNARVSRRTVDSRVRGIRAKLGPGAEGCIRTVRRVGYAFALGDA